MKRALIVGVGILALMVGVQAANAQANINPNVYPPYRGARVAQQPYEWYAAPGPAKRAGNMCAVSTEGYATRPYGFQRPCPAPQKAAAPAKAKKKKVATAYAKKK
jgi:hypothetical protein